LSQIRIHHGQLCACHQLVYYYYYYYYYYY